MIANATIYNHTNLLRPDFRSTKQTLSFLVLKSREEFFFASVQINQNPPSKTPLNIYKIQSQDLYADVYISTCLALNHLLMEAAAVEPPTNRHPLALMTLANPKPVRVCFSYAAYAKNLIDYLFTSNIPVEAGLSEEEVSAVESALNFTFPPDLRSILIEGLPVGPGFPNWRSSSKQQLEIVISLPVLGICKEVSRNGFWFESWGDRPDDADCAAKLARDFLKRSPILVPIYRHFYIPSSPCAAGNPVFYVHGGNVKLWSFDISGFFQQVDFRNSASEEVSRRRRLCNLFTAPAWASKEARGIEFWTEMAEREENAAAAARSGTRGWWNGDLGGCLEEVCRRLRGGGWKEVEIREMMMTDGCHELNRENNELIGIEHVDRGVRALSGRLLRAGWSREDVKEALGFPDDFHQNDMLISSKTFVP